LKKILLSLLLIVLVTGCSNLPIQIPGITLPATPTSAPTPAAQPTAVEVKVETIATPTSAPAPKNDPVKAVTIFVDSLKTGAPFALTSNLLSSSLAASVKDDAGLSALLGSPKSIGDFKIGSPSYSSDLQLSTLEATVYMPEPSNLRFSLLIENGEWKISEIKILTSSSDYPTTPEGVVLSFLTSYQEAPDRMSNFLTSTRRSSQPPGGASSMLQINGNLEGMVIQSAAVNPEPASASIKVMIRAGGKDYPRTFLLSKDDANWGIDAIEVTGN
jgi:hypothetical protein